MGTAVVSLLLGNIILGVLRGGLALHLPLLALKDAGDEEEETLLSAAHLLRAEHGSWVSCVLLQRFLILTAI